MATLFPAARDEEGQLRKDLWPPPKGLADPMKLLMQIAATQDITLEDYLFCFWK